MDDVDNVARAVVVDALDRAGHVPLGIAGFQPQQVRSVEFVIVEIVGQVIAQDVELDTAQRFGAVAVVDPVDLAQQRALASPTMAMSKVRDPSWVVTSP